MDKWHGCYDDGWQGIIVPEAFAHPAKMAYGLTRKIFKHALSESWIKPGDVVVDPFGGIGSTGIVGASMGLRVVCVELEEKFVKLGRENFERNRKAFEVSHFVHSYQPQIVQGDSRKLSQVLEKADCVVGSPPFSGPNMQPTGKHQGVRSDYPNMGKEPEYKTSTPGQLGSMKPGDVAAVISSPPYAETLKGGGTQNETAAESRAKRVTAGGSLGQSQRTQGYGSKGNLGNLKPGSVDAVVSSPPYEEGIGHGGTPTETDKKKALHIADSTRYSQSNENMGNQRGETFWAAAKQIVSECHKILRPGGCAIWVVKAFVRKGKIVDFPGDWRRLCEAQGFETVHVHHAMLVKETRHNGLFEEITEKKERKSFFRRLAESKGSPPIDFETVICSRAAVK